MPLITVVLPTWNRVEWLEQSINSVLEQTFKDFELFIVDDGSTDSTYEVLENYHRKIRPIVFHENFGVSKARNAAISKSDSEWVAFIDSDDYWHSTKLQNQIEYFKVFPICPIHFTDEIWIRN